jgi:hypothetical protein
MCTKSAIEGFEDRCIEPHSAYATADKVSFPSLRAALECFL